MHASIAWKQLPEHQTGADDQARAGDSHHFGNPKYSDLNARENCYNRPNMGKINCTLKIDYLSQNQPNPGAFLGTHVPLGPDSPQPGEVMPKFDPVRLSFPATLPPRVGAASATMNRSVTVITTKRTRNAGRVWPAPFSFLDTAIPSRWIAIIKRVRAS
jgi:hypothetical protein